MNRGSVAGIFGARPFVLLMLAVPLWACAPLETQRTESFALAPPSQGLLAKMSERARQSAPDGKSGLLTLAENAAALRWRLAMIDSAKRSVDVQTYVWKGGVVGKLLVLRLLAAADRGVRVRVLVDDFLIRGGDAVSTLLSSHPDIEVRVFNPWTARGAFGMRNAFEWLWRAELNHRMHNKLILVDGLAAIAGGRNIADEYFGLNPARNFADLDVLAVGPVIDDLEEAFDDYWNDEWSIPASTFDRRVRTEEDVAEDIAALRHMLTDWSEEEILRLTDVPLKPVSWEAILDPLPTQLSYAAAIGVTDDPRELRGGIANQVYLSLANLIAEAETELLLVSAYFVPSVDQIKEFRALTDRGIRVRVLTNSLASNNHSIVNSQYKRWREPLLDAGVELYEMRHDPADVQFINTQPVVAESSTLHTKAVVVDGRRLYIGALNLSPRGLRINAENGLMIEDAAFGAEIMALFEQQLEPRNAWRLERDDDGNLQWDSTGGTLRRQPARALRQRLSDWFFGLFPLEGQI
jgi:cardiolipin synthase C